MQLFTATFVKNKCIFLTILLQQNLVQVMSFQQFADRFGFETENVRRGKNTQEYLDYVTNLKILYEMLHFVLSKQKFVRTAFSVEQEWANILRGGPHFQKMLQPRAAHSHYKVGKFFQCANNRIFILQTIFICHTRYV